MVNINTVYQRVLAIANKEQRGYITPQEFNILANQAQMDIFDQYFYDLEQLYRIPESGNNYSSKISSLEEKISIFEDEQGITPTLVTTGSVDYYICAIPSSIDVYKLLSLEVSPKATTLPISVDVLSLKEIKQCYTSRLTYPSVQNPVGRKVSENDIHLYIGSDTLVSAAIVEASYIRRPSYVSWNFNIVGSSSLYNSTTSSNFELHQSEEVDLVNRILVLAGIMMKDETLASLMTNEEVSDINQEKQ